MGLRPGDERPHPHFYRAARPPTLDITNLLTTCGAAREIGLAYLAEGDRDAVVVRYRDTEGAVKEMRVDPRPASQREGGE
jgi:hypothetical protein